MFFTVTAVCAGVKVPKSVFRIEQIEEATEHAIKEGEPLTFIFSDPGSS